MKKKQTSVVQVTFKPTDMVFKEAGHPFTQSEDTEVLTSIIFPANVAPCYTGATIGPKKWESL
jgi:hypothetical protein